MGIATCICLLQLFLPMPFNHENKKSKIFFAIYGHCHVYLFTSVQSLNYRGIGISTKPYCLSQQHHHARGIEPTTKHKQY